MLIHKIKFTELTLKPCSFLSPLISSSISLLSTYNTTNTLKIEDNTHLVSSLINKPNWDQNALLKSLVSHMTPHTTHKIIELNSNNINLGVKFFKWVSKHSTYCYSVDDRILLLDLVVFSNLFAIAHKVIIELTKECSNSENDILKLMGALDKLKEVGFRINYPCYSVLLMGLSKVNLGFVAFLVYKDMEADGFIIGGIDYRTIINALCKSGYVQAGEMFLCRVLKLGFDLDTHVCTSLVLGYCGEHRLVDAFKVFGIMSKLDGCRPNSVTYSTLIHGLCEVGKISEAFELKDEMSKKGCLPSTRTYTVLIKAVCDIGLIDKALSLLDEMVGKGCIPNVHTYTVLIDGLCRVGKIEEANGMFRKMLQERLFPSTIAYNALINGYCKEERIVSAFEILGLMERRKCKPDICTYNELMEGLCRVNKSCKALFIFRRIVDNGLSPSRVTCNILINGFCKEGKLDLAFQIFNSMQLFSVQPDGLTFTSIIDGLCKHRKPELANGLLGPMVKKGISEDEVALTALMDGYCKTGKTKDALMLFMWMMEHMNLRSSHAFNLYINILCKSNKLKEEYAMFGKILKHGLVPSVVTYTILVDGLCRAGKIGSSLNMLELMKQAGCAPNVYTYTVIINGLCQNGRIQEAETLLFKMFDLGVSPNHITYTVLVKAHANAGSLDRALAIVNYMVKSGCQPNSRVYSALLAGFSLSNKAADAQTFSHNAQLDANSLPSEENVDEHLNINLALEVAVKIEGCGVSAAEFYNFVVLRLCKEGRMAEAEDLIRDKVSCGIFPDKGVCSIIEWHCMENRYEFCLEFMKLILDNGFVPSFESCCQVIQGLHSEGKSQQAQSLISELIRYSGVQEKTAVLPYIDFLVKDDAPHLSHEFLLLIEQLYYRERPVI